jgi:hypothetical protein
MNISRNFAIALVSSNLLFISILYIWRPEYLSRYELDGPRIESRRDVIFPAIRTSGIVRTNEANLLQYGSFPFVGTT